MGRRLASVGAEQIVAGHGVGHGVFFILCPDTPKIKKKIIKRGRRVEDHGRRLHGAAHVKALDLILLGQRALLEPMHLS